MNKGEIYSSSLILIEGDKKMKYFTIEINGEEIHLRLRSNDIIELEKKANKSIIEVMKDVSQTNIVNMLTYMRRFEIPNYSIKDANDLYDKFVDNDYSMNDIVFKVIYETLVVSGVMTKQELERLKEIVGLQEKKTKTAIEELSQK